MTRPVLTALVLVAVAVGCAEGEPDVGGPTAPATADEGSGGGDPTTAATAVEVSTLDGDGCPGDTEDAEHPDVVGVLFEPVEGAAGEWSVDVTLCSLYDSPDRYADAWRVTTPDGDVLGTRALLHDHAGEQPFTRSLGAALTVPAGVTTVVVEARDKTNGWGGATLDVVLTDG